MKGNRNPPPTASSPVPPSPTSKGTAKYTNKDGSKFITVPKMNTPVDSAQPSPTAVSSPAANAAAHATTGPEPVQPVNRKKQKRRAKAAAKAAIEQAQSTSAAHGIPSPPRTSDQQSADADPEDDEEEPVVPQDPQSQLPHLNGIGQAESGKSKKSKKKKKKNTTGPSADVFPNEDDDPQNAPSHSPTPAPPPPLPQHDRPGMSREKIWNTNSQEERERIKEFWLGLSEIERKSLVKVEKDAVLKKMKEQQKHTCSCTVCGRKRTAIEEELEGLYDAYYEELEQYANHPNQGEGPPMLRPRRSFGSMGSMRPRGLHPRFSNHQPSRGRIMDGLGDDGEEEAEDEDEGEDDAGDVYSEELEDDMYSEEEQDPSEELHRSDYAADFFNFGNSLTVQGGILTVADDLLKNDGKKFIEMMEQLAERRMAREEDARGQLDRGYDHANGDRYGHSHPPPPDEEEFEDDEEEYDEDDEEEYDSQDEEDTMTEEQRMEEGRRMFQIFAARMFEQRVLTAYREKVAKERQAKLLEEIEAENQQDAQRKAKKAKDAQRRKDKLAKKKEAQAEEKARRENEKAAEEKARREEEARKAEEQRAKAEEKRKKKEAQRQAEEEERRRKEADRLRKAQEREENERKIREAKEREKKARELKEKEVREQKDREARERREQQDRERREKDAKAKADREAKAVKDAKEGKDIKEKRKREERAAHKAAAPPAALPKRPAPQQPPAQSVATVPALPQPAPTSYASPKIPVATPAVPKAPTPLRTRQPSQQDNSTTSSGAGSNAGSMGSQNPSPHPITPVHASAGPIAPPSKSGATGTGSQSGGAQPPSHSASPMSFPAKILPPQHGQFGIPPISGSLPFPPGLTQIPPGFGNAVHRDPLYSSIPGLRPGPGMMPMPPGFGGPGGNRGFPIHPPPGFPGPMDSPVPSMAQMMGPSMYKDNPPSHSRQGSSSFDAGTSQPISRPTPIGRPASVVQGQWPSSGSPSSRLSKPEPDAHLGSRALLDDVDDGMQDFPSRLLRGASAPGPRPAAAFAMAAFGVDPTFSYSPWGPSGMQQPNVFSPSPPPGFGHSPLSAHVPMSTSWGQPMPPASTFGGPGIVDRPIEPRSVAVRKMLRRACEELGHAESRTVEGRVEVSDNFIALERIKTQVELFNHGHAVDEKELLDICETEGNEVNGGGSFDVRDDNQGSKSIRFVSGNERPTPQPVQRAVGYHPSSQVSGSANHQLGLGGHQLGISASGGNQVGGSG